MAKNFPGPYEIEFSYTVAGIEHKQRVNVAVATAPSPGADPGTIDLVGRDGTLTTLPVATLTWANLMADRFNGVDSVINNYILYRYAPLSFDRTFITTADLNISGNRVEPTVLASQEQYTFRTQEGGVMRVNLLETIVTQLNVTPISQLAGTNKSLTDYILSPSTWFLARDTSYPIAGINGNFGQNEAVFKARYRS